MRRTIHILLITLLLLGSGFVAPPVVTAAPDERFFVETSFRVDDDAFWRYFQTRGGVRTFGYPVSRTFTLQGFPVQIFQRLVMQRKPDGSVTTLNLLDAGLLPYTSLNGSTFPSPDAALVAATPKASDPQYAEKIVAFIQEHVPNHFDGEPVHFGQTFASTVTTQDAFPSGQGHADLLPLLNLEIWGAPTSAPARDPRNANFIYQRFQRGIMHYDKSCGCTQGLLLADYFKSVLTGQDLPADLRAQAQFSPFLSQYAPARAQGLARSGELPRSDLTDAFQPQQPVPQPDPPPPPPAIVWVQSVHETVLWTGPDSRAVQLGMAAGGDYLRVTGAEQGGRLPVVVARTTGPAWVDVTATRSSGPPPDGWPPPAPVEPVELGWVSNFVDAPLSADADGAHPLGVAPPGMSFEQLAPQQGPRLHVRDPLTGGSAWIEASQVGPVGQPTGQTLPDRWWGAVGVDGANLRGEPSTGAPVTGVIPLDSPVVVSAWVEGQEVIPDNVTWAKLAEGAYLYSSTLRPITLPEAPVPPAGRAGKWIDLNLTQQVLVAYEGSTPVRVARTSTGRPGWETPTGVFTIQRRVENETMESSTLLGLDAQRADYKVENVRWTQYFSADGMALHENYWKPPDQFGIPSSHGCVGLVAEDASFFWEWAEIGTPIVAHF